MIGLQTPPPHANLINMQTAVLTSSNSDGRSNQHFSSLMVSGARLTPHLSPLSLKSKNAPTTILDFMDIISHTAIKCEHNQPPILLE